MRFVFAIVVAALIGAASAISEAEYLYEFSNFQVAFNKSYSRSDFSYRFNVFKSNLDLITEHNAQGHSWSMAVNEFADLTWEEFKAQKLGYPAPVEVEGIPRVTLDLSGMFTAPASVDWRSSNVVTPVKNQGSCGSCWAFSATGSIEGAVAIKSGKLTSLSEQQLVDCSSSYGNAGCNGGLMDSAFKYVIAKGGICSGSAYPYTGKGGSCKSCSAVSKISKYVDVAANNEDSLLAAVALQPVSVAIQANQSGFQFYSKGVFDGTCGTSLDHGVLAVGYGTDSSTGKSYWLVKNSWGTSWGQSGYIRLVRKGGKTAGQCGIAKQASYPVAA